MNGSGWVVMGMNVGGGCYAMMTSLDKRSWTLDFASLKYGVSEGYSVF